MSIPGFAPTAGCRIPHDLLPTMILGMHFDGDTTDQAELWTFTGSVGYVAGKFDQGFDGSTKVIYDLAGLPVFNLTQSWRLQGWFRVDAISISTLPATIATLAHAGTGGGSGGPGGNVRQLSVRVEVQDPVDGGILRVVYNNQTGIGENQLFSSIAPVSSIFSGILYWFCVSCDGTTTRLYLGEDGDTDAVLVDENVGQPNYAGSDFTNQTWIIGASYAGGGWPGVHTAYMDGMIDDLVCYNRTNASTGRTGATVPMPTASFPNPPPPTSP